MLTFPQSSYHMQSRITPYGQKHMVSSFLGSHIYALMPLCRLRGSVTRGEGQPVCYQKYSGQRGEHEAVRLSGSSTREEDTHPAILLRTVCGRFSCLLFCYLTELPEKGKWTVRDSNPRPPRCERGALPAELTAHIDRTAERRQPYFTATASNFSSLDGR